MEIPLHPEQYKCAIATIIQLFFGGTLVNA